MDIIHQVLKKYWSFDSFRPLQEGIIRSVLEGNDTLALLPTGGGKSICFQIPALILEGVCIVVTPLIALMKDQVEQLKRRKIPAVAIFSGMSGREIDITLDNCIYGNVKFLYVSPERLKTEIFIERAKRMKVSIIAVDEAHCISQWGYDFRPSYLEIATFKTYIPTAKIIALTASATEDVIKDIQDKLEFQNPKVFRKSFTRENLSYSTFLEENKLKRLFNILKKVPGSSIVYVRSRKRTKEIAVQLQKNGIRADFYHAGLNNQVRAKKQEAWIKNLTRVIVATNAFGMGIDKPDVRTVIHLDIPDSLEAYYQEAGRAGRDEKKAYAIILFNHNDISTLKNKVNQEFPSVDTIKKTYQAIANYLKIAVGSSNLASFDFDFEDFKRTFNLESIPSYYSIKKLEEQGFLQLNESFYSPSKLFITVDNKTLYEYTVAHAQHDALIKTLLRMYGGELFTNFIPISESELARNLKISEAGVIAALRLLSQKNIVVYEQANDKPQLTFTTPRFDASRLPINETSLLEKKRKTKEKIDSIIFYTENIIKCRNKIIIEYFNENSAVDCGICDNCLSKKKLDANNKSYTLYRNVILENLKEEKAIDELIIAVEPSNTAEFVSCVRIMVANSEIRYRENGKISI